MRRKVLIGCTLTLVLPILFFFLVATTTGALISPGHTMALTAVIPAERQAVWDLLYNVEHYSEWNPIVKKTEMLDPVDGSRVWRETDPGGGTITFREISAEEPSSRTVEVYDDEAPYEARWEYSLEEKDGNTRLTIVETGEIPNPFLRFVMRFIVGNDRFQRTYFESIAEHFGEEPVVIEPAPVPE